MAKIKSLIAVEKRKRTVTVLPRSNSEMRSPFLYEYEICMNMKNQRDHAVIVFCCRDPLKNVTGVV